MNSRPHLRRAARLLHFHRRDENLAAQTPFSRPFFSNTSALFHFPYPATPLFATLTKTAGCIPTIPILELATRPLRSLRLHVTCFIALSFNLQPSNVPTIFHLSTFFSHSCALFCTHKKLNSFVFKRFRTLCQKPPGVGVPPPFLRTE